MKKLLSTQGIVWPARKECWQKTAIVIAASIAAAGLFIAGDAAFGAMISLLV